MCDCKSSRRHSTRISTTRRSPTISTCLPSCHSEYVNRSKIVKEYVSSRRGPRIKYHVFPLPLLALLPPSSHFPLPLGPPSFHLISLTVLSYFAPFLLFSCLQVHVCSFHCAICAASVVTLCLPLSVLVVLCLSLPPSHVFLLSSLIIPFMDIRRSRHRH